MSRKLKYPEGSFVKWCDEYYKIVSNTSDWMAKVMDMSGDIINGFYFDYAGETSELITDKQKIKELEGLLK